MCSIILGHCHFKKMINFSRKHNQFFMYINTRKKCTQIGLRECTYHALASKYILVSAFSKRAKRGECSHHSFKRVIHSFIFKSEAKKCDLIFYVQFLVFPKLKRMNHSFLKSELFLC